MADQENARPVDDFYPCDAVLMQTLAMARSVCLSQVRVLLKCQNKLGWFLASFNQSTLCCKEIQIFTKIRVLSSGILEYSGLRKFRHGISVVETCYELSLRKVDTQVNWTVVVSRLS